MEIARRVVETSEPDERGEAGGARVGRVGGRGEGMWSGECML